MKKIYFLFLSLYISASFSSCTKDDNNTVPIVTHTANVMYINACIGVPQVNGTFNGSIVSGASNINLFGNSGYQYVTIDTLYPPLRIGFSGSGVAGKDTMARFAEGVHYTALLGGTVSNPCISFTEDRFDGMAGGIAKIRFVNLTGDLKGVTFKVGSDVLFTGINPSQITNFTSISAGNTSFTAIDPTSPGTERVLGLRSILEGKYYTVYLTGTAAGTGNYNLQLSQIMYQP